jgi:hypothetical protein
MREIGMSWTSSSSRSMKKQQQVERAFEEGKLYFKSQGCGGWVEKNLVI